MVMDKKILITPVDSRSGIGDGAEHHTNKAKPYLI